MVEYDNIVLSSNRVIMFNYPPSTTYDLSTISIMVRVLPGKTTFIQIWRICPNIVKSSNIVLRQW